MSKSAQSYSLGRFLVHCTIILWLVFIVVSLRGQRDFLSSWLPSSARGAATPLAMDGGDPYLRALMRTISASESNVTNPYQIIYGGDHTQDLTQHPDRCIPIPVGPNTGKCSTAAGRYQFITTTWLEKAQQYHPSPSGLWMWQSYSFEPMYQDVVVYRWLNDQAAWGTNLSELLREGQLDRVLEILSPTWTSLGHGIETNSMSASLPQVYGDVLEQELAVARTPQTSANVVQSVPAPANLMPSKPLILLPQSNEVGNTEL